jgi:hypothetical protein
LQIGPKPAAAVNSPADPSRIAIGSKAFRRVPEQVAEPTMRG